MNRKTDRRHLSAPMISVLSDEDGNRYVHIAVIPGWQMQLEIEEEDLRRLAQEIKNELEILEESRR
jgi:hypothetical protein